VASAGIDAEICLTRGAAMLAMARMLANVRAVELWCVVAIGNRNSRSSLCVRLDTAPLDLARVAHVLTHPSVFRALGYQSLEHEFYRPGGWSGLWAFGDHTLHIRTAAESYRRVLSGRFLPAQNASPADCRRPLRGVSCTYRNRPAS
jgi:hypothetical protein